MLLYPDFFLLNYHNTPNYIHNRFLFLYSRYDEPLVVVAGSLRRYSGNFEGLNKGDQMVEVQFAKRIHPNYNYSTFENDIALLKLTKPIRFNNYTQPICLPRPHERFEGQVCQTSGWGALDAERNSKFDISLKFGWCSLNMPTWLCVLSRSASLILFERYTNKSGSSTGVIWLAIESCRYGSWKSGWKSVDADLFMCDAFRSSSAGRLKMQLRCFLKRGWYWVNARDWSIECLDFLTS